MKKNQPAQGSLSLLGDSLSSKVFNITRYWKKQGPSTLWVASK